MVTFQKVSQCLWLESTRFNLSIYEWYEKGTINDIITFTDMQLVLGS